MFIKTPLKKYAKGLLCLDLDSTLINCETMDVLAMGWGVKKEIEAITALGMRGNIPFALSLKKRLALLEGFPKEKITKLANDFPFTPGAEKLITHFKKQGFIIGIISGSFTLVAEIIAKKLDLDFFCANELIFKDNKLTINCNLLVNNNKDLLLKKLKEIYNPQITIAVGDGANDIPMLKAADIGIAFCAKEKVKKEIPLHIDKRDLMEVAYLFAGVVVKELE